MQYIINTGNVANDGTGEPLRTAFTQVNLNFDQVFNAGPVGSNIEIVNNSIITTNTNGNLILAPNGVGAVVARSTIAPDLPNVRSIGTSTNRFNTVYAQYLNANTSTFAGNLYVNGNLNVDGNIVTVNYSNLTVSNTTITLASGASNGAQADGAGILVDGANANFTYSYGSHEWISNLPVAAPAFIGDGSQLSYVTANVNAANILGNTINPTVVFSNLVSFGSVAGMSAVGDISTTGNVYANIVYGNTVVGILAGDGGNISNVRASAITGNVYYATFAGTATTANLAALATQSINADTALFALNANLASYANNAVMSQRANSAGYSVQSDYANSAVVAGMAYELAPTANLSLAGNIYVGGILTNNYYYANGAPFSGGGGSIIQSATPPVDPTPSTLWWDEVSGRLYVYYNDGTSSQWVDAAPAGISGSGGGGGSIIQSATPPVDPTPSTLWWNSVAGRLYVYYNDGITSQWVDAAPAGISGPGGNINLTEVASNIIPAANVTFGLGNSTHQWKDLWVSGNTIYIGSVPLTIDNGTLQVDGANVVTGNGGGGNTGDITFTNANISTIITEPIQIQPLHSVLAGINGPNLYLQAGDYAYTNSQVLAEGGALHLQGGNASIFQYGAGTAVGNVGGAGGPVVITSTSLNSFNGTRILNNWVFDNTGTLTLPNPIQGYANATIKAAGTSIAIGYNSGFFGQQNGAVAIGFEAGNINQQTSAVAIGYQAGSRSQGVEAVAVGPGAGFETQGESAVAIGQNAGSQYQGESAVAVGSSAGSQYQGANAVAIGFLAGTFNQANNTIILNATGNTVNGVANQTDSFYVAPVRNDTGNTTNALYYNTATFEISYGPAGGGNASTGNITFNDTSISTAPQLSPGAIGNYVTVLGGTGNAFGGNLYLAGGFSQSMSTNGNVVIIGSNVIIAQNGGPTSVSVTGNVAADYFYGNGAYLTNINGNGTISINPNSTNNLAWTFADEGPNIGIFAAPISDEANIGLILLLGSSGAATISWAGNSNLTPGANTLLLNSGANVTIATNGLQGSFVGNTQWVFGPDGVLTLPNADATGFGNIYFEENSSTITFGLDDNSTPSLYSFSPYGMTIPSNIDLPLVAKLNSGGVGNTNAAEFGTEVYSNGTAIYSSQIYMGAGTTEVRGIVDNNGAGLMYAGVEGAGFAGIVGMDPNVTSQYAIAVGPGNTILLGATTGNGNLTTTEYTAGVGALNANGTINGLLASSSNVVISNGNTAGWSFGDTGNLTLPSNIASINYANGQPYGGTGGATDWANIGNITGANGPQQIAIGQDAGAGQGAQAVAVGTLAGYVSQGDVAIAIGSAAGSGGQGLRAVAIGQQAGYQNQGAYSIAMGYNAGKTSQAANTIIFNATGVELDGVAAQTDSFYVAPIRNDVGNVSNIAFYNTLTYEVTYANTVNLAGNITATGVTATVFAQLPVYTTANLIVITGTVGQIASISDSPTSGGRIAFWDTTNNRWSYISDNSAV